MKKYKKDSLLIISGFLISASFSFAEEVANIREIGEHQKILVVEKNVHPQNKLIVYTRVDAKCDFILDQHQSPVFDFYWLMDGQTYKPMNSYLKSEIQKRLSLHSQPGAEATKEFYVSLNDLQTLNHDIPDPRLLVITTSKGHVCDTKSLLRLGPSNHNALIQVQSFYGEGVGTFSPKIISVTIKGIDLRTGEQITATYKAKN